ncbi:hypothetical protein D3C87_872550 [compost metagenome]
MATFPSSVPKPSEVVRRSQSFLPSFSSNKKGFPLKPGRRFVIRRNFVIKINNSDKSLKAFSVIENKK